MEEESIDPLCIIVVKSGAQGGKLLFKESPDLSKFFPLTAVLRIRIAMPVPVPDP